MKSEAPLSYRCSKWSVYFYVFFNTFLGVFLSSFAIYLYVFRHGKRYELGRSIIIYFLIFPVVCTLFASVTAWFAVTRKNVTVLKLCAVFIGITAVFEITGSIWCFISLPKIKTIVSSFAETSFKAAMEISNTDEWWDLVQRTMKCCGVIGPGDYKSRDSVPFSCCGTDAKDATKSNCTFIYQKGCANILSDAFSFDLMHISLASIAVAVAQIPAIFIYWLYANMVYKDMHEVL